MWRNAYNWFRRLLQRSPPRQRRIGATSRTTYVDTHGLDGGVDVWIVARDKVQAIQFKHFEAELQRNLKTHAPIATAHYDVDHVLPANLNRIVGSTRIKVRITEGYPHHPASIEPLDHAKYENVVRQTKRRLEVAGLLLPARVAREYMGDVIERLEELVAERRASAEISAYFWSTLVWLARDIVRYWFKHAPGERRKKGAE